VNLIQIVFSKKIFEIYPAKFGGNFLHQAKQWQKFF